MRFKGLMALLLATSMVSVSATVARLKALGMDETDNEGSYFIEDDRNIFLNVANVNDYADSVIIELGGSGKILGANTQTRTDADEAPKAKGGVIRKIGEMTYGIYVGNESNTSSLLRVVGTSSAAIPTGAETTALSGADNQIEAFVGGKASFANWGASVVYASDKYHTATARGKDTAHAVKFGLKNEKWDALLNISTGTKVERVSSAVSDEFDGSLGFHVGGGYHVNENGKAYGFLKKFDWDQKSTSTTPSSVEGGFTT